MPAANFQAGTADSQLGVSAGLREDLLDLVAVELGVVEAQLGNLEVPEQGVAQLGGVGGKTAADVLVALLVGGDVQGRGVPVVEVVEVGVEVGHVVHHDAGQLGARSLHCCLPVVQHSEVRSALGCVLVSLLDEGHLHVLGQEAELALDGRGQFLHFFMDTSSLGTKTKISK